MSDEPSNEDKPKPTWQKIEKETSEWVKKHPKKLNTVECGELSESIWPYRIRFKDD